MCMSGGGLPGASGGSGERFMNVAALVGAWELEGGGASECVCEHNTNTNMRKVKYNEIMK